MPTATKPAQALPSRKGSKHSKPAPYTHEQFIHAVRQIAASRLPDDAEGKALRAKLFAVKLVYGAGQSGLRGVTYYDTWDCQHAHKDQDGQAIAEICAFGEESPVQVAGTTLHELGHTISRGAGHGKGWKEACGKLGLRGIKAAGTRYSMACFAPDIRAQIAALPVPQDGAPSSAKVLGLSGMLGAMLGGPLGKALRPCGAGRGTRGGKSRGVGSGSRLRKFICACSPAVIVRAARDELRATCMDCGQQFERADAGQAAQAQAA